MDFNELIGLEKTEAEKLLEERYDGDFGFVYCTDRKQSSYDKELVVAVRRKEVLELVVCRFKFAV